MKISPGIFLCIGGAACAVISTLAIAQSYPAKPIRLVAPYPAGGLDVYARLIAPRAAELLGQPVVIDNRAGANGFIGAEHVARSAADGHTLLYVASGTIVHGVVLTKNAPFDPVKDFTPVINLLDTLKILTVHASLPVNSVKELIDHAKRNPGKLFYASSGIGSVSHLNGENFKIAAGINIVHVPYKGTAPMATDLVAGRSEVGFPAINNVKPYLGSGKLKLIAVLSPLRYAAMPKVPALTEFLPEFKQTPSWTAIMGPAGLPRPVVERLNTVFRKTLDAPDVRKFIDENGAVVIGGSSQELAATIRNDLELAAKQLGAAGIKPE